ncbi:MAG TPA: DUF1501 domain-containing protein, partial [Solirubrobacteraceae bacterium]|nr:DUF1501 domain-containing protein [Solirubrobacteraceae bacterium]
MADCCQGFSRSQALRRAAAATAGRGLPAIEPGMPVPAGTGLSRRSLLLRTAGLGLSVYGASHLRLPGLEEGVAQAAAGPAAPILVSVFMPGGADSMSVLAPVGDPRYAALRPTLALPASSGTPFAEDPTLHWHPAAAPLATLHAEGKVSALPAVGYDHPDQSHFTSRHYWEVGELSVTNRLGWMGRYLDAVGSPDNPLQGLSLDDNLSPALATSRVAVAAAPSPKDYDLWAKGVWDPIAPAMRDSLGRMGRLPASDSAMTQARRAAANAQQLSSSLGSLGDVKPAVSYPTGDGLPAQLSALAAMISAGLPMRCVTVNAAGGFDTHANQAASLPADLGRTCQSLLAFQRDLEARGVAGRVLVLLWSEFGRRPQENGSGTDHGAAGCAFVIGTRAKGQMVGE